LIRSLLYVASNDRGLDQQSALVLNAVRQQTLHLSIVAFKAMVRQQAFILHQAGENALHALTFMVPKPDQRTALLSQVEAIVAANGALTPEQSRRLVTLSESLTIPLRKPGAAVLRRRPPATSA
jgi:hypothetical protein